MTRIYAGLAAFGLVAVMGATVLYTQLASAPNHCEVTVTAGADIGGPFDLVNAENLPVTDRDIIDRPALVYFGYTFCPDVCPFDVARNAEAVDLLKAEGLDIGLVFITVDPARDTPDVLADYQFNMHPDLIGLTGTPEQIDAAAKAYKVYYARGSGEEDYYLIDHSVFTYLMLPGNELATFFRRDMPAETLAEKTACLVREMA